MKLSIGLSVRAQAVKAGCWLPFLVVCGSDNVVDGSHGHKCQLLHCRKQGFLVDVCARMVATWSGVLSSAASKCTNDRSRRKSGASLLRIAASRAKPGIR